LSADPGFPTLWEALARRDCEGPFLSVLVHELEALPRDGGVELRVVLSDASPALATDNAKRAFHASVAGRDRTALEQFVRAVEAGEEARYHDASLPLRFASGGFLPVVEHRGARYFALLFRDIFPVGWNLACGASGDLRDLLDVARVGERELREELLIRNRSEPCTYHFDLPEACFDTRAFQAEPLVRWDLGGEPRRPLPCSVDPGPDAVTTVLHHCGTDEITWTTDGLHLVIDPVALGIECVRVVHIPLPDDLDLERDVVFLDGELKGGGVLDSVVGLTPADVAAEPGAERPFPHVYREGKRLSGGLNEAEPIRTHREARFALCPITAGMFARYAKQGGGTIPREGT